jgi:hypothetical protein
MISLLLSHYIMLLKQRTVHAGFMFTDLLPTNHTTRSFDATRSWPRTAGIFGEIRTACSFMKMPLDYGQNVCASKLCNVHMSLKAFVVTELNNMFWADGCVKV